MDLPCWFVVDTGMLATGMLDADTFRELAQHEEVAVAACMAADLKGEAESRVGRFPTVGVGDLAAMDVILWEGNTSALGLGFLSRCLVTLDFPRRRVFFGTSVDPATVRDEVDMTGMSVVRVSGKTMVRRVEPDGPSDRAGIRPEDQILSVNGKAAEDMKIWEIGVLRRAGDGKKVRFSIERRGKTINVTVTLRSKL
jgi:membrane-associated protease RseP (regulator of RpoE activity)